MPTFKKHFRNCRRYGIDEKICTQINKEMDRPSLWIPGCAHRKFRHQLSYCEQIAQSFPEEIKNQAIFVCKLHIQDDCGEGKEICKQSLPCKEIKNDEGLMTK